MDPKVILMPVYSRGNEIERLRGALSLARYFNAHLNVIFAQSRPSDLLGTELFAVSASVRDQLVSIMDSEANQDHKELRAHLRALPNHSSNDQGAACLPWTHSGGHYSRRTFPPRIRSTLPLLSNSFKTE